MQGAREERGREFQKRQKDTSDLRQNHKPLIFGSRHGVFKRPVWNAVSVCMQHTGQHREHNITPSGCFFVLQINMERLCSECWIKTSDVWNIKPGYSMSKRVPVLRDHPWCSLTQIVIRMTAVSSPWHCTEFLFHFHFGPEETGLRGWSKWGI